MRLILKVIGLICLAVAAFSGLITLNLPLEFGWAGLFFWFLADLIT
jgi:hypothetical protein